VFQVILIHFHGANLEK